MFSCKAPPSILFLLLLSYQSFTQPNLSRGLVAYYPLDGNAIDVSGNNLNGILRNGVASAQNRFNTPNSAMNFDGVDDYIEIPDNPKLRFRDSFSITFLFNRTANSIVSELIEKRDWADGSKSSFDIGLINPGKVRTAIKTGSSCDDPLNGWVYPTVSNYINPDQWYCVATTFNKGEVRFYVDGQLVGISSGVIQTMDSCVGSSIRMGIHWKNDPLPFQGKMDEVRIFSRALSTEEVQSLCTLDEPVLCKGSLGDPVVNISFGAGNNPGGKLENIVPGASTTAQYISVNNGNPAYPTPVDGQYTITNNVPYNAGWFSGAADHTPNDLNGYMAFFNSSEKPGEFYNQTINGLCGSTTYEFAAWIANVLNPNYLGGVLPDLTFRVEKPDGTLITSYNSGPIKQEQSLIWKQYGFFFKIPAGVSSVKLRILNNNVGGTAQPGNDLALDDITFRACGPELQASFDPSQLVSNLNSCSGNDITLYGSSGSVYTTPAYLWQISQDSGTTWTDIPSSNKLNLMWSTPGINQSKTYFFRMLSAEANLINSVKCRVGSNQIQLTVSPSPSGTLSASTTCDQQNPQFIFKSTGGTGSDIIIQMLEGTQSSTYTVQHNMPFSSQFAINGSTQYKLVSIQDQNGCINTSPGISINVVPGPIPMAAFNPLPGCAGDSARIQFSTSTGGGPFAFTFSDAGMNYTVKGAADGKTIVLPFKITNPNKSITLHALWAEAVPGCIRTDGFDASEIRFAASPTPQISFNTLIPVCAYDEPVILSGAKEMSGISGSGVYSGNGVISTGQFDPALAGAGNHSIRYTYNADNGCTAFAEQSQLVLPKPVANAGPDLIACIGTPIQLKVSGGTQYAWSPATGLSDPAIANPIALVNSPVKYIIRVTDPYGCWDQDTLNIHISSGNRSGFSLPNAFTPNGDGKNDCFGLQHWGQISLQEFSIYNRWGQRIFTTTNPSLCWNGQLGGRELKADAFVYVVSAITGCGPVNLKGIVHLVR